MTDTQLIKFARMRDDFQLRERIAAALTLEALYRVETKPNVSVESENMMNWVLDNPLQPIALMTAFVVIVPAISEGATIIDGGGIDTSSILDADIRNAVNSKWEVVASRQFTD